jgi:hypothetical protein
MIVKDFPLIRRKSFMKRKLFVIMLPASPHTADWRRRTAITSTAGRLTYRH